MSSFTTLETTAEEVKMTSLDFVRATWTVLTSLLVFVFGMLGNVATVYIYTRTKELRQKKVFELILASFDIYTLVVLLPIFTFELYANQGLSDYYNLVISVCVHSYYITILCSNICRYVAVYHPFSFNAFFAKWRMRFIVIICFSSLTALARSLLTRIILEVEPSPLAYIDIMLLTSVSFVAIAVLFILIILKLMKQNTVGPQAAGQTGGARKKHLVAVKTFGAVSLCFLISYVTGYTVAINLLPLEAAYVYFLNHICNPVIYFLFNREFREKVRDLMRLSATE